MNLLSKKVITHKEYHALYKMIQSPDPENLIMAQTLIEHYEGVTQTL